MTSNKKLLPNAMELPIREIVKLFQAGFVCKAGTTGRHLTLKKMLSRKDQDRLKPVIIAGLSKHNTLTCPYCLRRLPNDYYQLPPTLEPFTGSLNNKKLTCPYCLRRLPNDYYQVPTT